MNNTISLRSGVCPLCASKEVYNNSTIRKKQIITLSRNFFVPPYAQLLHYCCADCGHIEVYMNNPKDREKMRQHWTPLNPKQKRKRKNDE